MQLLVLWGPSTLPTPDGFHLWGMANGNNFNKTSLSLLSWMKSFTAKPTELRGLQALHCMTAVCAKPSSPIQLHCPFWRGDALLQLSIPRMQLRAHEAKHTQSCLASPDVEYFSFSTFNKLNVSLQRRGE